MPRRQKQLSFDDVRPPTWGGARKGAGRKATSGRPIVHHVKRPRVPGKCPCHVRVRVQKHVPSLRRKTFMRAFRRTVRVACERGDFRVVHYSVQKTHVHLIVEAQGKDALGRGMKSISARIARAVQRVFGLSGAVLDGRYFLEILRNGRYVRNTLAYVLLNARKHYREARRRRAPVTLDVCSSGAWFDGWAKPPPGMDEVDWAKDVAGGRTELLTRGWRHHRRIDPGEEPGRAGRGA